MCGTCIVRRITLATEHVAEQMAKRSTVNRRGELTVAEVASNCLPPGEVANLSQKWDHYMAAQVIRGSPQRVGLAEFSMMLCLESCGHGNAGALMRQAIRHIFNIVSAWLPEIILRH